jgi:hypothetical protein
MTAMGVSSFGSFRGQAERPQWGLGAAARKADTLEKLATVLPSAGHSAPRSRLSKISSNVGSMRIGLPQIRIEDGSRLWEGKVS